MSFKRNCKKDIILLYNGTDEGVKQWSSYFEENLAYGTGTVQMKVESIDIKEDPGMAGSVMSEFANVTLMVSADMLDTMEKHATFLGSHLANHRCVTVILLFVDETDLDKLQPSYCNLEKWKRFQASAEDTEINDSIMADIIDIMEQAQTWKPAPPVKPKKPTLGDIGNTKHREDSGKHRDKWVKCICPQRIKQAGEEVALMFRQSIDGKVVQVTIGDSTAKIETEKQNPYCCTFKAQAHKPGKAAVYVYVDGERVEKRSIRYQSVCEIAYTCPSYLCQVLGVDADDIPALDRRLAAMFQDSMPDDRALGHILTPRGLADCEDHETDTRFPTILHFACHYGLQDLASKIAEAPGAYRTFTIQNSDSKQPLDLAREAGHEDLADYLENLMDMEGYVQNIGQFYMDMNKEFYNNAQPSAGSNAGAGYITMHGGRDYVEEYITGRVGRQLARPQEDDYEIKVSNKSEVEEVVEGEDITEQPLPVVPPRKPLFKKESSLPLPEHTEEPLGSRQVRASSEPFSSDEAFTYRELPLYGTSASQGNDPVFSGRDPLSPGSMGSTNLDELLRIQESYKNNEFTMDQIQSLYAQWMDRNKDQQSASIKEKKEKLDEIRNKFKPMIKETGKQSWLMKRLTGKKKKVVATPSDIKHNVTSNQYSTLPAMSPDHQRSNRDSNISTCSTASSSSTSSRDSVMSRESYMSSDSQLHPIDEGNSSGPDEFAPSPPSSPPARRRGPRQDSSEHRKSLGEEFLQARQNQPRSRLPPLPRMNVGPILQPARQVPRRGSNDPSAPIVPPRKLSNR